MNLTTRSPIDRPYTSKRSGRARAAATLAAAGALAAAGWATSADAQSTLPPWFTAAGALAIGSACSSGSPAQTTSMSCNAAQTIPPAFLGLNQISGSADAFADIQRGQLDAVATSTGYNGPNGRAGDAAASADLFDSLTFHGAIPPNALGKITMSATYDVSTQGPVGVGTVGMYLVLNDIHAKIIANASACTQNNPYCSGIPTGTVQVSDTGKVFSISEYFRISDFTVDPLSIRMSVNATAFADSSAEIHDPITLSLPQGVSFTSASGLFLTGAPGGVPEPGSWALMVAGLAATGGALRIRARARMA